MQLTPLTRKDFEGGFQGNSILLVERSARGDSIRLFETTFTERPYREGDGYEWIATMRKFIPDPGRGWHVKTLSLDAVGLGVGSPEPLNVDRAFAHSTENKATLTALVRSNDLDRYFKHIGVTREAVEEATRRWKSDMMKAVANLSRARG